MEIMPDYLKESIKKISQDPKQLRFAVIFGIGFIGLGLIAFPLLSKLRAVEKELTKEIDTYKLIRNVETLNAKLNFYNKYLNKNGDINWWIQYMLNGIRGSNLLLKEYTPTKLVGLGVETDEYMGYEFKFNLEGRYYNVVKFVNWIESNKWEMRIVNLDIRKDSDNEDKNYVSAIMSVFIMVSKVQ